MERTAVVRDADGKEVGSRVGCPARRMLRYWHGNGQVEQ